jgi:hypothetical protein
MTTTSDPGEAPPAVTELDLTGDRQEDVVVRIPVMGLPALRGGLVEIGFDVKGVTLDENVDLRISVSLPDVSYAYGQDSWLLSHDGGD